MNILFVCTGNTCRSPMAEAILRHRSADSIDVQSAGLYAASGNPASPQGVEILQENGVAIDHRSQPLSEELLDWADVVLTMTTQHKQAILAQFPHKKGHVFTLKEHVSEDQKTLDKLSQLYDKISQVRSELMSLDGGDEVKRQALFVEMEKLAKEIQKLEETAPSLDISDPYGGPKDVYCQTYEELDELVQKLTKKYS